MLSPKVTLTDELIHHIQETRMGNIIGAAVLSEKIGKPSGYISALENKRIKTIASSLLIKIFLVLHDNLSEDEVIAKIEAIINVPKTIDKQSSDNVAIDIDDEDIEEHGENESPKKNKKYNLMEDYNNPDLIKGILNEISKRFSSSYKNNPKDTVYILSTFLSSMRFDTGFVMAMLSLPYFGLNNLTHDERQNAFDDIQEVFKKHLELAESKEDNNE